MTDREAFEDWYEVDSYPCEHSNWFRKDADGDYEIADVATSWNAWEAAIDHVAQQERKPAWYDAPTEPGVWLRDEGDALICHQITLPLIHYFTDSKDRWYGPIPEDKK